MLRVVIGDNDRADRLMLRGIINQDMDLLLEGEAEDESGLLALVEKTIPHVVFLSIDIPGLHLNHMIQSIESINHRTFIVLTSSAEFFSKEAMDAYVFHRLYKPLDLKKTTNTMNRMKSILSSYENPNLMPFHEASENIKIPPQQILVVSADENLTFVKATDIIMITRSGRKTEIHTASSIFKVNETLEKIEARLGSEFFRSHKGYIVNSNKINSLTVWSNKTYLVNLNDTRTTALMTFERFKLYRQLYCIE